MAKKTSKIEKQERIDILYELVVKGWSTKEILRYSSDKWSVSERTTENYLSEIYDELKKRGKKKKDHQFQLAVDRNEMLYKKNMTIKDYREARQVQQEISKLFDLYSPTRIDHTTGGDKIATPSIVLPEGQNWEDLKDRIKKIENE